MALKLMGGAKEAIKAYLEAGMSDKLDALDEEYDDYALDDIQTYYKAQPSLRDVSEFPVIAVLGESGEPEREGDNYIRGKHRITIAVMQVNQDTERLADQLDRYVRAIVELLKEARGDSEDLSSYIIQIKSWEFSPIFSDEDDSNFMADARVEVILTKNETTS